MIKIIPWFIIGVFFFPLLPPVMGNSQIHINFLTLLIGLIFIFRFRNNIKINNIVVLGVYFLLFQLLLFFSFYFGLKHESLGLTSILSTLRPLMLFVVYLSTVEICRRYDFFYKPCFNYIVAISFFYLIFELFCLKYSYNLVTLLYKRDFRPELFFVGTTFFGTSYYSGYSFYCIFLLSFVNLYNKRNLTSKAITCFAFFLVLSSLSKTMILCLFISTYLMLLVYVRSYVVKLSLISVLPLAILSLFLFQTEISTFLSDSGIPALSSIKTLLYDSSNSGSLNARSSQIFDAFELGQSYSLLFGAGLGQDASIESLPAVYLYRYGTLGLMLFYTCNLLLLLYSSRKLFFSKKEHFAISFSLWIWVATLPITQLSGVMIEQSKMAVVSALMVGYLLKEYNKLESNYV